ncbi:MAG: hypothetical protein HY236_07135 [Acidobacteria bacterium]|nr:hypothetical protein [Acidobacteriota bacterium]
MSQAELPLNGLIGAMEAFVETAKRVQEFEDRYRTNEAAFERIHQQYQQMQESAGQLQALTEERLAALSTLNVELKVRHSKGEQALEEAHNLLAEVKAQQARWEQEMAALGSQRQADADRSAQAAQTLGVVQALAEQVQNRQAQLEQSQVALRALIEEQGKRVNDHEKVFQSFRNLGGRLTERQAQVEKTVGVLTATQEAEKSLLARFEKTLGTAKARSAEIEQRQAQIEQTLAALQKQSSGGSAGRAETLAAVEGLTKECKQLQAESEKIGAAVKTLQQQFAQGQAYGEKMWSGAMAQIEEVHKTAAQAAGRSSGVEEKCSRLLEEIQSAQSLAKQALEKAEAVAVAPPAPIQLSPQDQEKAANDFRNLLARWTQEHQRSLENETRLQTQMRMALEGLPARAETSLSKFLEECRGRVEQLLNGWLESRGQHMMELENRFDGIVVQALETGQKLEKEAAKHAAPAEPQPAPAEWMDAVESATATHTSELRFVKTLLWVTLAAVGLAYALVFYAVIPRS